MTVRQHIAENRTINTDAHKPIQMGHIRYQDNRRQSMIPIPETDAYQTKTGNMQTHKPNMGTVVNFT